MPYRMCCDNQCRDFRVLGLYNTKTCVETKLLQDFKILKSIMQPSFRILQVLISGSTTSFMILKFSNLVRNQVLILSNNSTSFTHKFWKLQILKLSLQPNLWI
jgi:hypothetical protein